MKTILIKTIFLYRIFVSPFLGKNCRFYPSCSEYVQLAIDKHGVFKGLFKGILRILRCNPFHPGGIDFP